ncbi:MAG: peptide-methionine (S)-S-oxide reductase MsrA [Candidatus Curtissbacteria bacterium]|nr:peptide-methionine (S)-S-oxide reductase MsrA [Candidatus Curtissbacteria bacterium]
MEETATIAGGCFWCTEAIFKRLKGVESVTNGYSGGKVENPTYEQVCSGTTGHAESIQIEFDPNIISYEKLLEVFFKLHDPTTLNQQGADIGTQYRSSIFYHSEAQKKTAEKAKKEAQKSRSQPIVTEIIPFENFYKAENYHQNYYEANKSQPYCQIVIDPKIQKLYQEFKSDLKPN